MTTSTDQRPSLHDLWVEHSARYDAEQAPPAVPAPARAQRHDGWTPERQRTFLDAVADGYSTEVASRLAGMSPSSAYAFRKRAAGQAFALGWRAAALLGRDRIADTVMARAIDGYTETVTRANGDVIERHRFDNRLAMSMLARLDRQAEALDPGSATANAAARLVAAEFEAYLAVLDTDAPAAAAGRFLAQRHDAGAVEPTPLTTLTRADRFARTGAALAGEVDAADLDPADHASWTVEQWQRAAAAGLIVIAEDSPVSPLHPQAGNMPAEADPLPVWFDSSSAAWRTSFPPPPGFDDDECGTYGDREYSRPLTPAERVAAQAEQDAEADEHRHAEAARRDRWFAQAHETAAIIRAALAGSDDASGAAEAPPATAGDASAGEIPLFFRGGDGEAPVADGAAGEGDAADRPEVDQPATANAYPPAPIAATLTGIGEPHARQ